MNENNWTRWVLQTAKHWDDLAPMIATIGIEEVDSDHRRLAGYALEVNCLIDKMNHEQFNLELIKEQAKLLKDMYKYTCQHFRREEILMDEYELPGVDEHKKKHTRILHMLESMVSDFESGKTGVSQKLKFEILEWIVTHINEVDRLQFQLENWKHVLQKAKTWKDVSAIIRKTGIRMIDEEHQEMTEKALRLSNYSGDDYSGKDVTQLWNSLLEIVNRHFKNEEEIIKKYGISGIKIQHEKHLQFTEMLNEYHQNLLAGKCHLEDLKLPILEWWVNHINDTDYKTFCLQRWADQLMSQANSWDDLKDFIRSVGIEAVDQDHRRLVEMTIDLHRAIKEGKFELGQFGKLVDFVKMHFQREESLMEEENELHDMHRSQHRSLISVLENYRAGYETGEVSMSASLKTTILQWWINHTNEVDYLTFADTGREEHGTE